MMEYWNDGILGFGKIEKWGIDKICLDMQVNKLNS